ncbi:MAG: SiaB family protein kinase [Bacteroidota bacterium]|nr:SiaB family protein kinase [Bacteroidota bacterium]
MSITLNKEDQFFDLHFEKQIETVNATGKLALAYDGVLNTETISKLEGSIEEKILENNLPKMVVKKVFFICVESLQNMFIHGHRDDNGAQHNFFILYITDKAVKITTANLISNSSIPKLTTDIERINSFSDPAALKAYYLEHLENNELSEKGGAGLGFITIAMKSGNKLGVEFNEINEKRSLFLLQITINIE